MARAGDPLPMRLPQAESGVVFGYGPHGLCALLLEPTSLLNTTTAIVAVLIGGLGDGPTAEASGAAREARPGDGGTSSAGGIELGEGDVGGGGGGTHVQGCWGSTTCRCSATGSLR